MATRVCVTCKIEKPEEDFRWGATLKNGKRYRASNCNPCHREEVNTYRWANIEQVRERDRERTRRDPAKNRERARAWYYANRERAKAQRREAYERDPELFRDRAHLARARKEGAPKIELVRRVEVFDRDGGVCHVCGEAVEWADYEMDHVVPLSRGGSHTYANVKVTHKHCNLSRRPSPTHCPHGHPYDTENTHVGKDGYRSCRTCARERARQNRAKHRAA